MGTPFWGDGTPTLHYIKTMLQIRYGECPGYVWEYNPGYSHTKNRSGRRRGKNWVQRQKDIEREKKVDFDIYMDKHLKHSS
jgi:hypothetical protein